jgi:hypothetical protein
MKTRKKILLILGALEGMNKHYVKKWTDAELELILAYIKEVIK